MEYLQIDMQQQPEHDDVELIEQASNDAVEQDGTPVLDEQDLKENNLTEEEAEQLIWDEPAQSKKKIVEDKPIG